MDDDRLVQAIAATVRAGGRRRVVGCGGIGKSFLLDRVAAALGDSPLVRWTPAIEPQPAGRDGVLLADDVHVAEPEQVRMLTGWPGGVVATHRPARSEVERVLDALDGSPLVLDALDLRAVGELLTVAWGQAPPPRLAEQILAATGGVPRLVHAVGGTGPIDEIAGTAALDEIIRTERQRLERDARALLDAAGVLTGLDISVLAAAADLPIDVATDAAGLLAAAGLTLDAGGRTAPVVAAAVRRLVPASTVTAVVDRAATTALRMGYDLTGIAECISEAGVTSPAAAVCLLGAARQVLDDAPARAHAWIEAAGRGGAAGGDLAALRALVAFRQGDVRDTVTAVDALLQTHAGWHDAPLQRDAVEAGAVMLARRGAWSRSATLAAACGPGSGDAVALAAIARLAVGDAQGLRAVIDQAAGSASPQLRAAAAATLARALHTTFADDPTPALPLLLDAADLYELAAPTVRLPLAPRTLAALVACQLWEFDVAAQVLADPAARGGDRMTAGDLLTAWVALRRGDWVAALAEAERYRAVERPDDRDTLVVCAVEGGVARRRGDLEGMDRAWREARTLLLRLTPDLLITQPLGELLICGARLGDRATVHNGLTAVRRLLARADHPPLWRLPVLWDEMHIAIALDDLAGARAAAAAAAATRDSVGRAVAVTDAARCWVDALAESPHPERVRSAATGLADIGLTWEASRLAGTAAIRLADGAAMRELLRFARGLSAERTPRLAATGDLSPRERDVAAHLLAGLTYREIGGQLYIAPKTVEHHVASIRRKLGVKTRAELLLALRRHVAIV